MKFNKWTLGLAAVGVVSLASAVKAEEKLSAVQSALSSTTISGYVDTSLEWTIAPNEESTGVMTLIPFRGQNKQDGFNLNVVKLSFEKPLEEGEWASGYKLDLLAGPDAVGYNASANSAGTSDFGIKQAYIALRTPIGNGLDWKVGVFDTIIGYESFESGNNPNFTRSWGWAAEPTQHTGVLASYKFNENVAATFGIANTLSAGINNRNTELTQNHSFGRKTWMASLSLTAPESMGALKGSTLYFGIVDGFAGSPAASPSGSTEDQLNLYVGATVATPVKGLKVGAALDYVENFGGVDGRQIWVAGVYASFQATEKLSLHARGEYGEFDNLASGYSLTGTLQYDLWANVISRLELRWDEADVTGASNNFERHLGFYANLIYKF
ncbi:MAG: hypothetical protein EXS35_04290 [Pedosphaera sp.]|nr:hypothetical protein [Pedosphaera sp.]